LANDNVEKGSQAVENVEKGSQVIKQANEGVKGLDELRLTVEEFRTILPRLSTYVGYIAAGLVLLLGTLGLLIASFRLCLSNVMSSSTATDIVPLDLPLGFLFCAAAVASAVASRTVLPSLGSPVSNTNTQILSALVLWPLIGFVIGWFATQYDPILEIVVTFLVTAAGGLLLYNGATNIIHAVQQPTSAAIKLLAIFKKIKQD